MSAPELQPGEVFGRYRVEAKLGQGAFGTVYRALDLRLRRPLALKILHSLEDANTWGRLLREAQTASALSHPNLCAIYDVGEEAGLHYIAMEYVEGRTLKDQLSSGGLSEAEAFQCARQISSALSHAHERRILHRDLKSANVMVTPDGQAKLLDFGLAQRFVGSDLEELTQSRQSLAELGDLAGTLAYVAPEVLKGKPASPQSDLWSFGVLLHEMLSGSLPFQGSTPFELSTAIMLEAPRALPFGTSPALRAVVEKCLAKDPRRRYASASGLLRDLEARPAFLRSKRAVRSAAAVVIVGLAVALLVWRGSGLITVPPAPALPASVRPPSAPPASLTLAAPAALATPAKPKAREQARGSPGIPVWVNTRSGTYHCPGTRWYQKTAQGQLMSQLQAQQKRYRPASGRACP